MKIEEYNGTLKSAKLVLKNLKIKDDLYHFNIITKELNLIKYGLILRKGDYYDYFLPEKIEAIG